MEVLHFSPKWVQFIVKKGKHIRVVVRVISNNRNFGTGNKAATVRRLASCNFLLVQCSRSLRD